MGLHIFATRIYPHATPRNYREITRQLTLKQMDITQQIKDAHPWLSYDEVLKVLLYHQGSIWVQNRQRDKLERSMEAFTKLVNLEAESP